MGKDKQAHESKSLCNVCLAFEGAQQGGLGLAAYHHQIELDGLGRKWRCVGPREWRCRLLRQRSLPLRRRRTECDWRRWQQEEQRLQVADSDLSAHMQCILG